MFRGFYRRLHSSWADRRIEVCGLDRNSLWMGTVYWRLGVDLYYVIPIEKEDWPPRFPPPRPLQELFLKE